LNSPSRLATAAAKDGSLPKTIESILGDVKPEAAYFTVWNGKRTAFIFLDIQDPSDLPAVAEPWFLAFNANVDITPAMVPEDLQKSGPAIGEAVQKYG
jgi:hypothetical protein